jgi:hypothetical protein
VALGGEGGPHRLQDAAGDPDRDLVAGGLLEQDGELVAAQAGDGVLAAHAGLEPAGHGHQQVVAGRVAEAVVDRLEKTGMAATARGMAPR